MIGERTGDVVPASMVADFLRTGGKKHKYGVASKDQRMRGGRLYASKAERDYRAELDLLVQAGDVRDIIEQPRVELEAGVFYKPDFFFLEHVRRPAFPTDLVLWLERYVDVKGVTTQRFHLIQKLWRLHGPAVLRIVKRSGRRGRFVVVREILPKGAA